MSRGRDKVPATNIFSFSHRWGWGVMGAIPMKKAMGTSIPQGIRSMKLDLGGVGNGSFMGIGRVGLDVGKDNGSSVLTYGGGVAKPFLSGFGWAMS